MANRAKKGLCRTFNHVTMPAVKVKRRLTGVQDNARNALRQSATFEAAENAASNSTVPTGFIDRHIAHLRLGSRIEVQPTDSDNGSGCISGEKMKAFGIELVTLTAARLVPRLPEHA